MKRVLKTGIVIMGIAFLAPSLKAQEKKGVSFQVSGDVVSSYVWRGAYNAGASIQPTLGMSIGNFSFTAWGSKEISDTHKEIDLTAAYSIGGMEKKSEMNMRKKRIITIFISIIIQQLII